MICTSLWKGNTALLQSNAARLYHAAVYSSAVYCSCSTNISSCSGNIHTLTLCQKTQWNYLPSIAVWLFIHILLLFQLRERTTEEMTKISQPTFLEFSIWKLFQPYSLDIVRNDSSVISAALNITAVLTINIKWKNKNKRRQAIPILLFILTTCCVDECWCKWKQSYLSAAGSHHPSIGSALAQVPILRVILSVLTVSLVSNNWSNGKAKEFRETQRL